MRSPGGVLCVFPQVGTNPRTFQNYVREGSSRTGMIGELSWCPPAGVISGLAVEVGRMTKISGTSCHKQQPARISSRSRHCLPTCTQCAQSKLVPNPPARYKPYHTLYMCVFRKGDLARAALKIVSRIFEPIGLLTTRVRRSRVNTSSEHKVSYRHERCQHFAPDFSPEVFYLELHHGVYRICSVRCMHTWRKVPPRQELTTTTQICCTESRKIRKEYKQKGGKH